MPWNAAINTARETLITFFDYLNADRCEEGDTLYGGTYEALIVWNPTVDRRDTIALLRNACKYQLQCLRVRNVLRQAQVSPLEYSFMVEFTSKDGSLFVRGPCCGADATPMPPQSQFAYTVARERDGQFRVMGLPVYVP